MNRQYIRDLTYKIDIGKRKILKELLNKELEEQKKQLKQDIMKLGLFVAGAFITILLIIFTHN